MREIRVRNGQTVRAGDVLVVVDDVRSDAELSLLEDQLRRRARAPRARQRRDHARARTSISTRNFAGDRAHRRAPGARARAVRRAPPHARRADSSALQTQVREARAQAAALSSQIESIEDCRTARRRGTQAQREAGRRRLRAARATAAAAARRRRLPQPPRRIARRAGAGAPARRRAARAHGRRAQSLSAGGHRRAQAVIGATARARRAAAPVERPGGSPGDSLAGRRRGHGPARVRAGRSARRRRSHRRRGPSNEMLVVEARIRPQDINHVFADAKAKVRLAAFDARTTPLLPGRVTFVSPDRMSDARNRRVVVRRHGRGGRRRAQTPSRDPAQGRHAGGAVRDDFRSHPVRIPREADHGVHEPRHARNLNY